MSLTIKARIASSRQAWREYTDKLTRGELEATFKVGIAASFTANNLAPFVGAQLLAAGIHPKIEIGPYNQIFQVCLNYEEYFDPQCDAIIIFWRMEDLLKDEILTFLHGDRPVEELISEKLDLLVSALKSLRSRFKGALLLDVPPYPTSLPAHLLHLDNHHALGAFHRLAATSFQDKIKRVEGVRLFDADAVQRVVGHHVSFDSRQWYLYRQPLTDAFGLEVGTVLARMIVTTHQAPKKCVVLDCDNTLWGGIIGEDGLQGIQIGDDFPGSAFRDFQRLLLYWRHQGVLLAIASKNNEADVWEVFEKRREMILKREHISAWQINWNPKADNIPLIAESLNIGTDSLVFIDDSAMELDYMRSARPEVVSVAIPEEPADILDSMQHLTLFDGMGTTKEDRSRASMMQAEQTRKTLETQLGKEEFLRALGLQVDLFKAADEDLERITQLINKTNQFNLTTKRRSLDEIRALFQQSDYQIFGVRVMDKFGEYGLTGVVIAQISPDHTFWTWDTFLLSCRVLGRGVETAVLNSLAQEARAAEAVEFIATFIPSAKNGSAASYLPSHGFHAEGGEMWRITLSDLVKDHETKQLA